MLNQWVRGLERFFFQYRKATLGVLLVTSLKLGTLLAVALISASLMARALLSTNVIFPRGPACGAT